MIRPDSTTRRGRFSVEKARTDSETWNSGSNGSHVGVAYSTKIVF